MTGHAQVDHRKYFNSFESLQGMTWVHTVCKGYQQRTKAAAIKERVMGFY